MQWSHQNDEKSFDSGLASKVAPEKVKLPTQLACVASKTVWLQDMHDCNNSTVMRCLSEKGSM